MKTREKESGERDEFRVGNFRQKSNSGEDRIYGTNGYFPEQKTLGIQFRTLPWKRKQLGIPFHGTKIEANSRKSVLNSSAEEKLTQK